MTLVSSLTKAYRSEKPVLVFLLKLLILASLGKILFYLFNRPVIQSPLVSWETTTRIILWSLLYDILVIAVINLPFLLLVALMNRRPDQRLKMLVTGGFSLLNAINLLLNYTDIFYYRFHLQRADADMLYVIGNPFAAVSANYLMIVLATFIASGLAYWLLYRQMKRISYPRGPGHGYSILILGSFILAFLASGTKKVLPTYPLTNIQAFHLPLVQNSLHSFVYSVYRRNETILPDKDYMDEGSRKNIFTNLRRNETADSLKKNIVLFVMESVPSDFFEPGNKYKVKMPFLDSLAGVSTYFTNAFSYSHNSNKGITAILAGLPTLVDIPLYHSKYISLPVTKIGKLLKQRGYGSAFFIGDNYDDFGFAKCCNWLGIENYYCRQDIPGQESLEQHTMGLHDKPVLKYMYDKIGSMPQPFLAIQYNISTHFPNDLPAGHIEKFPAENFTPQMKSMSYYNDALEQFFHNAKSQPWYNNSVFIFCSDHWMYPDQDNTEADIVQSFRIPIFIFDPNASHGKRLTRTVSQLDIMNTMLHYSGSCDSIISYGNCLLANEFEANRTVFAKENTVLYQAFDSSYVLGFNAFDGRGAYAYNYKTDPIRKNNLVNTKNPVIDSMTLKMKAFLQAALRHYNRKGS